MGSMMYGVVLGRSIALCWIVELCWTEGLELISNILHPFRDLSNFNFGGSLSMDEAE
jgi:hypothetical protein